jgi:hypothetical protein
VSEWDQRQLCDDGGCVGVIGSSGTCSVCGKRGTTMVATAADSGGAKRGEATDFDEDDEYYYEDDEDGGDDDDNEEDDGGDDDDDEGDADVDEDGVASVSSSAGEWNKRELCSDGGCVGVIGDNGKCSVCGKSAGPG